MRSYQKLIDRLREKGIQPKLHLLDNEFSEEFKEVINNNGMKYQLVPPHDHRRNISEKDIQVFKYHFVSVLCGTDKKFPLKLWCQILPYAEHQLNLLQKSRALTTMSAFAHMYGQHDYDSHSFALLGCDVKMHVMPSGRKTWESHTKTVYYLGTSWEHYLCHKVWIQETKSTRVVQTVFF